MIGRERPNPTEEPEVEHRSTAGRNARRQPPELFDPAANDCAQRDSPRQIEEDDRVCFVQTSLQALREIAVDDPAVTCDDSAERRVPFASRRRNPAGAPIESVEVIDRHVEQRPELPRERRLPRPGSADNRYALQTSDGFRLRVYSQGRERAAATGPDAAFVT